MENASPIVATIRIDCDYTLESARRIVRQQRGYQLRKWILVACCAALVAGSLYAFNHPTLPNRDMYGMWTLVMAVVVAGRPVWERIMAQRNVRKLPHYLAVITFELGEAAVRTESETESGVSKWEVFTKAIFFEDGFLLYSGPQLVTWFPRTAFVSQERFAAAVELVNRKVEVSSNAW